MGNNQDQPVLAHITSKDILPAEVLTPFEAVLALYEERDPDPMYQLDQDLFSARIIG